MIRILIVPLILLAAACTVEVVAPTMAPTMASTQKMTSMEQTWIDNWTEDGSSVTEARCTWQAMVDYYGSETVLIGTIATVAPADMWGELVFDPAFVACWES